MRQQVRDIREGDEQGSLDRLMSRVGLLPPMGVWELETFNQKSARSRIEMLALLALGPRHPLGHISLRALASGERIAREIYVKRYWEGLEETERDLAESAANRVLLDGAHTGLYSDIRTWNPASDQATLHSHLIDDVAFDALRRGDVGAFLRHRGATLQREVKAFVDRLAGWDEPALRPLEQYLEIEEEEA